MEGKTIRMIILTFFIGIIAAWGMNSFLNIFVNKQKTIERTEAQSIEQSSATVEASSTDKVQDTSSPWTLYDFAAIAAALFLVIAAIFFPQIIALGFFAAGTLLLVLRLQTESFTTNVLIWAIGSLLIIIFSWFKFKKTATE